MPPIIAFKLFLLGLILPSVRLENRTENRNNVTQSENRESNNTEEGTDAPPLQTEERENVTDILLIDLPAGSDYGFGDESGKEVLIKTKNSETKGLVHKKNSLFSKNLEVEECEKGECKKSAIDDKFKKKLEDCTYTGKLVDDPDSTLSVTNCEGVMQMTYMSSKANLSSNSFRKENGKTYQNEGIIKRDQKISKKGVEETLAEETARKVKSGDAYLTPDGETVELEEVDSRDYSDDKCCRVKKKICKKDKVTKKTNLLSCRTSYSDTKCGVDCEKYKERISKNSKKNIENIMKKNQTATEETKSYEGTDETTTTKSETSKESTTEESTTEESTTETTNNEETTKSYADKDKKDNTDKDVIKESFYNELFGEEDEEKDKDDKEEKDEKKTTGGSGDKDEKSKDLRDLVTDELVKLNEDAETSKKRDAPKSNSMFRSKVVKMICSGGCAEKADNPTEKIYDERTIELGIFVDKYLWNNMKDQVEGGEAEVKLAMLDMIHSLIVSTETLYQHPTVSAKGGFKLAINGIVIWKDDNDPLVKAIHDARDQNEQLYAFQEYAKQNNEPYDGYQRSYDMNILLSGTHDKYNIGGDAGIAFGGVVCRVEAVGLSTVTLREGKHLDNMPALIAHEMGHILGAAHDGTSRGTLPDDTTTYNIPGTCPEHLYIMTPSQSGTIVEWSECSRRSIDFLYEKRESENSKNGNCFYT